MKSLLTIAILAGILSAEAAQYWSSGESTPTNRAWAAVPPWSAVTSIRYQIIPGAAECAIRYYLGTNALTCTNVTAITAGFSNYTEIATPAVLKPGTKILLYDRSADNYERAICWQTNTTGFHVTNDLEHTTINFAMANGDTVYPMKIIRTQPFIDTDVQPNPTALATSCGGVGGAVFTTREYPGLIEITITNSPTSVITNLSLVVGGVYR